MNNKAFLMQVAGAVVAGLILNYINTRNTKAEAK